jgi:hypothetical protein
MKSMATDCKYCSINAFASTEDKTVASISFAACKRTETNDTVGFILQINKDWQAFGGLYSPDK